MLNELINTQNLSDEKLENLLTTDKYDTDLMTEADKVRRKAYGDKV